MYGLPKTIPDVEVFLALSPEELAGEVLTQLQGRFGRSQFHPGNLKNELGSNLHGNQPQYPANRIDDVRLALSEAWAWLENSGLIIPALDSTNANAGWRILSRRGLEFDGKSDFGKFLKARQLPKTMLHPDIAERVWLSFVRGEFDTAVFQAMKAVEIAVREAACFPKGDHGVPMIRRHFIRTMDHCAIQMQSLRSARLLCIYLRGLSAPIRILTRTGTFPWMIQRRQPKSLFSLVIFYGWWIHDLKLCMCNRIPSNAVR